MTGNRSEHTDEIVERVRGGMNVVREHCDACDREYSDMHTDVMTALLDTLAANGALDTSGFLRRLDVAAKVAEARHRDDTAQYLYKLRIRCENRW